jgi:hypothetical protein
MRRCRIIQRRSASRQHQQKTIQTFTANGKQSVALDQRIVIEAMDLGEHTTTEDCTIAKNLVFCLFRLSATNFFKQVLK